MKRNGIVRKVDKLGRVVIPKEWRDELEITEGTPLEIIKVGERFEINKYEPCCHCCGESESLRYYKGLRLCSKCLKGFKV